MEETATTYLRVYCINGHQLAAGDDITEAIETFRIKYPTDEITSVEAVRGPQTGHGNLYHLALVRRPQPAIR